MSVQIMTPRLALEKLTAVRLRFGDPQHLAWLGVLRSRNKALEMIEQIGADECALCNGEGVWDCKTCNGTGTCPECGGSCGACEGFGNRFCSVCGGTGRAIVSMDADPGEIRELIEKLEGKR